MEQGSTHMVYSEEDYIEAIRENAPATTKEVADAVGVTRQGADYRLRTLEDNGVVESQLLGNTLIWTVIDESDRPVDRDDHDHDHDIDHDHVDTSNARTLEDDVDAVADDVLPGSGAKLEERRDALLATVEYLQENGEATPADLRENVYPDHPARYTTGDDPARSWWKNAMYKGLSAVADRSDDLERADSSGTWRYTGGNK